MENSSKKEGTNCVEKTGDRTDEPDSSTEKVTVKRTAENEPATQQETSETKKIKIGFGLGSLKNSSTKPNVNIQMKKPGTTEPVTKTAKPMTIKSSVFGEDDDEEVEEMPPEARMRMKNIGRDTPTSAGPNSFGKTKQGFCDTKKLFEKQLLKKGDDTKKDSEKA